MIVDPALSRVFSVTCGLAALLVIGTCGFVLMEGWQLLDSLYMTLITISTVGYGEIHELSRVGRVFASFLICLSMVLMVCWTAGVTSFLVSNDLSGQLLKKKELKMISKLANHIIVCGGGMMARTIVAGMIRNGKDVVVIANNDHQIELLRRLYPNLLMVTGDPTSEIALADANVLSASYLIAATECDQNNLLITIAGSGLGTDIKVISCSNEGELINKMRKVGASEIVCPMVLCGEHVISTVTQQN